MPRGDWGVQGSTLQVPFGTLPGWIVTTEIPAELVTFYALEAATMAMVQLYELSATSYEYDGLITVGGGVFRVFGGYNGVVTETGRYSDAGLVVYGTRSATTITLAGSSNLVIRDSSTVRIAAGTTTGLLEIQNDAGTPANPSGRFTIDGISAPRSVITYDAITGNPIVSVVAAAEVVVATSTSGLFRDTRAFKAHVVLNIGSSPIVQPAIFRIRRGNTTAGTTLSRPGAWNTIVGQSANVTFLGTWKNASGANITDTWCVTIQCPNATAVNLVNVSANLANQRMEMHAWDIGADTQFPGANSM